MEHKIHIINQKTRSLIPDGVNVLEEIIADEGMKLTQSEDVDITKRIIASAVMLGKDHSSDEWKEITEEKANVILEEQTKLYNELQNEDTKV